jgi:DNA-binding transcriptional ArsR family regulator
MSSRADELTIHRALGRELPADILRLLSNGELSVADLQGSLTARRSAIVRELSFLREHGLVEPRSHGDITRYGLSARSAPEWTRLLAR